MAGRIRKSAVEWRLLRNAHDSYQLVESYIYTVLIDKRLVHTRRPTNHAIDDCLQLHSPEKKKQRIMNPAQIYTMASSHS